MFKEDLYEICNDVASEFPGWTFASGQFKNKSLKHTDLLIHLGFGFAHKTSTALSPAVFINNKKSIKLYKQLFGYELPTSVVNFQIINKSLIYIPENLRSLCWIEQNKQAKDVYLLAMKDFYAKLDTAIEIWEHTLDLKEAQSILSATLKDGIAFIEGHYDLSSEENFLKALPPKYTPSKGKIPYDEFEQQKGVMMCVVRLLLGDFEFVERYRSDSYETVYPKRTAELEKIIAALPELKKRYAETGKVI